MLQWAEHVIPMIEKKSRGTALKASAKNKEELGSNVKLDHMEVSCENG
jgi:hypothetical protein